MNEFAKALIKADKDWMDWEIANIERMMFGEPVSWRQCKWSYLPVYLWKKMTKGKTNERSVHR
jgi:hypothetical protein